ncbi:MAG: radical SAM protein [Candidatus Omnitrophota bacterium]
MRILALVPGSKFSKNVARDLVYGCWCKGKRIAGIKFPPLSLLSVATVLRNEKFTIDFVDAAALQLSLPDLQKRISDYNALIILTSTMTLNEDAELLLQLKKTNPALCTIVFGGHVTAEPESTLQRKGVDIVVRGEAEYIIRDVIKAMSAGVDSWREIRGISFIMNGQCVNNPPYPLIDNLDDLPIPDRSMLSADIDYFNPVIKRIPYTTMFTSRGCPGECIFCSSPYFYGRKIRFRSANRVLEEMEMVSRAGYKEVFFRDEIFTVSKKRVLDICKGIIGRGLDLTWVCSARIGSVDLEMLKMMKLAGCHMVRFGVESGAQKLLDNIKKGTTLEQIYQTFNWTHELNIDTHAHMMIGLPGENKESLETTIKFVKKIEPTVVTFGILTAYPGTPLFSKIKRGHPGIGDGTQADLGKLHTNSFYNEYFTDLDQKELSAYIRKVYREFYMRPKYILKWLRRINNIGELKRIILAGTQVFDFICNRGE